MIEVKHSVNGKKKQKIKFNTVVAVTWLYQRYFFCIVEWFAQTIYGIFFRKKSSNKIFLEKEGARTADYKL